MTKNLILKTFTGTAHIFGKDRDIVFDGERLTIGPFGLAQAESVVALLAAQGVPQDAQATPATPQTQKPATEAPSASKVASTKPASTSAAKPAAAAPKPAPAPAKSAKPAVDEAEEDEEEEVHPAVKAKPSAAPAASKAKTAPAPEPEEPEEEEAEEESEEVDPRLVASKKLRDVLVILMDAPFEITDPDGLVAKCEELKEAVPVLSRITNIDERVRRTLEVIERE